MIRLPRPSRDILRWLVVGLALREAFSFWTGHPFDSEIWIRNAYYVAHGWSPYSLMPPVPGLSFAYTGGPLPSVAYLPLWSLLLAGIYQAFTLLPGANRFVLYFLIKQPPILGDMALGSLLFLAAKRWGAPRPAARQVLAFWMVFPYPILIAAVWGQFDSLVAALVLGALLATSTWKRSGLLGLGVLLKSLPIIFVPYEVLRARGRARAEALLAVAIPALFTAAVFAVTGWGLEGFTGTVAWEGHGVPAGMTYGALLVYPAFAGFVAANASAILLLGYLWIPAIGLGAWWAARRFAGDGVADTVQAFAFLIVLLFLTRWTVNEQYLIYLLPLLLLDVTLWHPERRALFDLTWILGLAFLVLNNLFLVRFASPAFPGALPWEFALTSDPTFAGVRGLLLAVLGVLFSLHMVQLGRVLARPGRPTTPWLVHLARRTWSGSVTRLRSRASGRGG